MQIKKGDLYDFNLVKRRLNSIIKYFYLNNGYLFFDVTFFEKKVSHNSISLEFYIKEGFQSSINKIIIIGNNKTNNSVILRQFCIFPGDKFNRTNIIKSNKNIFRLNIFNSKNFSIFPFYNIFDNTIDVTYKLKEKSNDQIQITGGWSGGLGFIGSLEIFLNNFSFKNIVKFKN